MTQLEDIKIRVQSISDPLEMAGFIDGIRVAAALYCKERYPDEVIFENGEMTDISIYGICQYLNSDLKDMVITHE